MPDPLRGLAVIRWLGEEHIRHEGLRVAVIEREQARLHLHHHPVARLKHVVRGRQSELVRQRLVRCDRLGMLETLAVAAAEDRHRHGQLIAPHLRRRRHLVGIDVDQLHHPVAVTAAGGGLQVDLRRAGDAQRRGQRFADVSQHVGAAVDEALVVHQPGRPHVAVAEHHGARHERHRLRGIGHVFVVLRLAVRRRFERQPAAGEQVQRLRLRCATLRTTLRPGLEPVPMVFAGVVDEDRRRVGLRCARDQVLVEERLQHVAAELQRGIAVPLQRTERRAVVVHLAVPPRAHDQVVAVVAGVARFHRLVAVDRAPHVLLVPQALQPHGRHLQRGFRHDLVQRLLLPESVVGRVLADFAPPRQLFEPGRARVVAGRAGAEEVAVVVTTCARDRHALATLGGLAGEITEVDLAEGTVVEPVVAHPAVDHRAFRCGHLQRRMRVRQRHHHGEPLVRGAKHADAAVGFRDVLHQPVDGVVGVGRMVDLGVVERSHQRPRDHVVALRAVFPTDILEHADVAALHEHLVALRQDVEHVRRSHAAGAPVGIVGRARQQDRRVVRTLRHHDDRVQLDAVAHRDHHLALDVVVAVGRRDEILAGDVRRHRRRLREDRHRGEQAWQQEAEQPDGGGVHGGFPLAKGRL